jgi:hypothetical protein
MAVDDIGADQSQRRQTQTVAMSPPAAATVLPASGRDLFLPLALLGAPARGKVKLQKRSMKHAYDDEATLKGQDILTGKILT